jgi:ubiquinone/menaquinone biosynthesis C-methylase UbiE
MAKYDKIGLNYDRSRRADPYLLSRLLFHLGHKEDKKYLDIACGSGNYTTAMSAAAGKWCGIDQSTVMLEKARSKSSDISWLRGAVNHLPFKDDSFDGVICTLAIHHFDSLPDVFLEVRRVLGNGRFVLFTSTTEQMKGYWLSEYFPKAMESSWNQMPGMEQIVDALGSSGFQSVIAEPYSVRDDLEDFFLYSGKHRPEFYLDPLVRKGISTFSSLAKENEIHEGCRRLSEDIESGRINEVISFYANDLGDYSFVISK